VRRACAVFVAHDLDDDMRLLRAGRLSAVLHHDLNQDMRPQAR
jgi:LacI family transcriptional regulator